MNLRIDDIEEIYSLFKKKLDELKTEKNLEEVRLRFLSRKGLVNNLIRNTDMSKMSEQERQDFGKQFNELKRRIEEKIKEKKSDLAQRYIQKFDFDLTVPGTGHTIGRMHPIMAVQMQLESIFQRMGYIIMTGFEIETEFYNFDALNIPFDHPAREMQDTYWLKNGCLLRTHTSATQVRALKEYGAPMRAIFPGRCFRYETIDASHENTFFQLEGLMVDHDVTVAHLIGAMKTLLAQIFEHEVHVRMRPGYFPFVEPGFELDIQCMICDGKGCFTCKSSGWIELIPCGLVHPRVLKYGGVSPQDFSGFAFGLGLTRLAMMKYHIPDIRLFNCGDIRFYEQFMPVV